jgi:hypothetical protein
MATRRLILSRKGFDAKAGKNDSPILPDGRMVSLPIPTDGCGTSYKEIEWLPGRNMADLMRELGIKNAGLAHHDPDLDERARPRTPGWRPIFGQAEQASKHLMNQGVTGGDTFLFFGRFRRTKVTKGGLGFVGAAMHVLWGYLVVGEVRDPATDPAPPKWAASHPHYACRDARWFTKNNRVYIASAWSKPNGRTGGAFPVYRDELCLSAPNGPMSRWRLPLEFHPDRRRTRMSNTNVSEWSEDGAHAYVQAIGQRQEFMVEMSTEIEGWTRDMIDLGISPRPLEVNS